MSSNGAQAILCRVPDQFNAEVVVSRVPLKTVGTEFNKYHAGEDCLYLYNTETSLLCGVRTIEDAKYPDNKRFDGACGLVDGDDFVEIVSDKALTSSLSRLKTTAPDDNKMSVIVSDETMTLSTFNTWGETVEKISMGDKCPDIEAKYDVQLFIDSIKIGGGSITLASQRTLFESEGVSLALAPISEK